MSLSLFVLTSVRLRFKWFVQPKLYQEISFSHAFMSSSPVKRLVACKRLVQHGFGFDLAGRQRWLRVRWQSFPDWPCTFKHCALDMFSSQPHHCHVCFCFLLLFLFKSMQLTGLFEGAADVAGRDSGPVLDWFFAAGFGERIKGCQDFSVFHTSRDAAMI